MPSILTLHKCLCFNMQQHAWRKHFDNLEGKTENVLKLWKAAYEFLQQFYIC